MKQYKGPKRNHNGVYGVNIANARGEYKTLREVISKQNWDECYNAGEGNMLWLGMAPKE